MEAEEEEEEEDEEEEDEDEEEEEEEAGYGCPDKTHLDITLPCLSRAKPEVVRKL